MSFLALLLIGAAVALGFAKLFRLPAVPLLLIAGIIIQWAGLDAPEELLLNTLELGLIVLVFAAGVELNPGRFKGRGKTVVSLALVQFLGIGGAGYLFARLLGYETTPAVFLAFALSASSTLTVIRLLKQRQQMFEPFGRLVTGTLLLQDLFIIVVIVALLRAPEGATEVGYGVASTIGLGALAAGVQRWLAPWAIQKLRLDEETLLLLVLTLLFAFCGLAFLLDLPLITGAFLAGFALSGFPVNGLVRGVLLSLSDFFLVLFFTTLGAIIVLPGWDMLLHGFLFGVFLIIATVPLVAAVAERSGVSARSAIESALLLAQTSEFSLILALYGLVSGQLSQEIFSMIALLSVATMTLTPFLASDAVTWKLMRMHPSQGRSRQRVPVSKGHVVVLGYANGMDQLVRRLLEAGRELVIVDDDPGIIRSLRRRGRQCLRGDAADPTILQRAGAHEAMIVLCTLSRLSDARKVLESLQQSRTRIIVRVFDEADAAEVERLGGIPIICVSSALTVFMEWMRKNGYLSAEKPTQS